MAGKLSFFHTFKGSMGEQLKLKVNSITVMMPEIYHSQYEEMMFRYTKVRE